MSKYNKINTLLADTSGELHALICHTQLLMRCNQILQSLLSAPLKEHARIANIAGTTLVVTVDSAVWLTRAKLQLIEIFEQFKQTAKLNELKQTRVKVDPLMLYNTDTTQTITKTPAQPANPLSQKTLSQINQVARHLSDKNLKNALLALAQTLEKKTEHS